MSEAQDKYKDLLKKLDQYGLEPEQLAQKLVQVYELAISNTEERINPKLSEPVEVKVSNLPVALACVKTMAEFAEKIRQGSGETESSDIRYELVQSWVSEKEDWLTLPDDNNGDVITTREVARA